MKIELVKDRKKLILLFLGYSFNPSCIKHLKLGDYGLCVVYDYSDLKFDSEILKDKEIYLIAWSMGVWAANLVLKDTTLKFSVAINGTPFGIDDEFGIKKENFYKSISEFDLEGFKKLCFLGIPKSKIENFEFNKNAKFELINLYKNALQKCENHINWDKAIISKKDLVFPKEACLSYFKQKAILINAAHFVFFEFESFGDIFEI